jgi:hypothetical protein
MAGSIDAAIYPFNTAGACLAVDAAAAIDLFYVKEIK